MSKKTRTPLRLSASKLRENVYQILDEVLMTGEAAEIYRHGEILRIEPPRGKAKRSKLANLTERPGLVVGNSDDLIHLDWSGEWRP